MSNNVMPNFLVIGAARCATTSLHAYLSGHPDVFLSEIKEINFFSNSDYWNKGLRWYARHFEDATQTAVGEASTSYTAAVGDDSMVPKRIRDHLGNNTKLIYMVRDPVARLKSHYLHQLHRGVDLPPLSKICKEVERRDMLWQGRYAHQLQLYLRYFDRSNLLTLSVEDLKANPNECLRRIFEHIGVDCGHAELVSTGLSSVRNSVAGNSDKGPVGRKVRVFYNAYIEQTRVPYKVKKMVKFLSSLDAKPLRKIEVSAEEQRALNEFYIEDAQILEADFGVVTRDWSVFGPLSE